MDQTKDNNIKYRRKDVEGGYLFDKEEIAYFKQLQNADVVDNYMVGDFNMVGTYVIDKPLLEQLINLNKVFLYEFSKTYFCESISKIGEYGKLQFAVKVQPNTPKIGTTTAILQLLEPVSKVNGYIENTNVVFLATFMDVDSPDFIDRMFDRFHIYKMEDAGKAFKENQSEYQEVLDRKNALKKKQQALDSVYEKLSKDFFEKRLKLISKNPDLKVILEDLNKKMFEVDGMFIKKTDSRYYRYLNQILDSVLELHDDKLKANPAIRAELLMLASNFSESVEKSFSTSAIILPAKVVKAEVKKEAKKEEKKAESGSKSKSESGKSSGYGGLAWNDPYKNSGKSDKKAEKPKAQTSSTSSSIEAKDKLKEMVQDKLDAEEFKKRYSLSLNQEKVDLVHDSEEKPDLTIKVSLTHDDEKSL